MAKVNNPVPLFLDARGALLDGGRLFFGAANADPEASPITVYWDAAMTIPAAQPVRTLGGRIVNGGNPAFLFIGQDDYSMRVRDANGVQIDTIPSTYIDVPDFQPLDSDLTAIAALATTAFGRSLLTLANSAALKAATGIPDCIPQIGGPVTGNITRSGAGAHAYGASPSLTGMRIFAPLPVGSADPTSQPGDIVGYY